MMNRMYNGGPGYEDGEFQKVSWPMEQAGTFSRLSAPASTYFECNTEASELSSHPSQDLFAHAEGDTAMLNYLVDVVLPEQMGGNPLAGGQLPPGMSNQFNQAIMRNNQIGGHMVAQMTGRPMGQLSTGQLGGQLGGPLGGQASSSVGNLSGYGFPSMRGITDANSLARTGTPLSPSTDSFTYHDSNSMVVTEATDPVQAGGLINFALAQHGSRSFFLFAKSSTLAAVANLLRVVQNTWTGDLQQLITQSQPAVLLLPYLPANNSGNIGAQVMAMPVSQQLFAPASSQAVQIDISSNPMSVGSSIAQAVGLSSAGTIDILFKPEAASAALRALVVARINVTSSNQSLIAFVFPQRLSGLQTPLIFRVRVALSNVVLSLQQQLQLVELSAVQGESGRGPRQEGVGAYLELADRSLANQQRHSGNRFMAPSMPVFHDDLHLAQHTQHASAPNFSRFSAPAESYRSQETAAAFAAALAPNRGALASGASLQQGAMASQMMNASGQTVQPSMMHSKPDAMMQLQNKARHQEHTDSKQQQQSLRPSFPQPHAKSCSSMVAAILPKSTRFKRADYVIVTEDTLVKNAAGALAKVLGRLSHLRAACPLFIEKKSETYTAVVGVGVKAIAVSRGYVCNEATGHEVAFQPYLCVQNMQLVSLDMDDFMKEKKTLESLKQSSDMTVLMKSVVNQMGTSTAAEVDSPHRELLETVFDVYKVPMVKEPDDPELAPVKVTAHSRVSIVSGIITRLVEEKGQVELVTAGGSAMHVAMHAVIQARCLLQASDLDILLLPRFHTVNTMSTHGYESVFLRFHIVRTLPVPIDKEGGGKSKFLMQIDPAMIDTPKQAHATDTSKQAQAARAEGSAETHPRYTS